MDDLITLWLSDTGQAVVALVGDCLNLTVALLIIGYLYLRRNRER